jgi:hypothetical protein
MENASVIDNSSLNRSHWGIAFLFGIAAWLISLIARTLIDAVLFALIFAAHIKTGSSHTITELVIFLATPIAAYLGIRIAYAHAKRYYSILCTARFYLKPFLIFALLVGMNSGWYATILSMPPVKYSAPHITGDAWAYLLSGIVTIALAYLFFRRTLQISTPRSLESVRATEEENSNGSSHLVLLLINLASVIPVVVALLAVMNFAFTASSFQGGANTFLEIYAPLGLFLPLLTLSLAVVSHLRRSPRIAVAGIIVPLCYIAGTALFYYLVK